MKKFTDLRESNKGSVSVKTQQHDFGKMMTVHHGSNTSYPLHPEHQEAISKLKPGEKTHFKDETGNQVHAHRVDNDVHLHRPNHSNTPTKVPYHHFDESFKEESEQIDELSKGTLSGFIKKSKETFKDVPDAKKGNRLRNVLIAAGKKDAKNEESSSRVYKPEVERAFPASGVKTIVPKHKYSTMPKDKDKAKGVPAGSMYKEEIQNIEEGPKDPPFEPSKSPFKKSNNPNRSFLDSVKALAQKGKKDAEKKSIKETFKSPGLSSANANAEYRRNDSNSLKLDVKHLGGVSSSKAIKQHLALKGITAGLGSSDNYQTVHLSDTNHSHDKVKNMLGIKEATGDKSFDSTMKNIVKGTSKQRTADRIAQKKQNQERARNAFGSMFGGGNPTSSLKVKEDIDEGILDTVKSVGKKETMFNKAMGEEKLNDAGKNAIKHASKTVKPTKLAQIKDLISIAKSNKKYVTVHNPSNDKVNENSLHADFLKMLNDKGIKHRVHGTPEQEKQRTAEKLASNKAKVDASPKKPAGPGTFGNTRGYGQGRYMGD